MNQGWLRYLPAALRERIAHRPYLQKVIGNTGWLFADKILRMGVGLIVGVWIARYLGPEQFGLFNYAIAIVALFGAVAGVGLNGIVVRDLINQPDNAPATLGSSLALQIVGGFVACGLALVVIVLLRPDDPLAKLIVAVLGFALVFKASDVVRYWFEAQVQSRYVVWVENGVFLLLAAFKVGLLLSHAPLMAFVWASFAEALLVAVGLFVIAVRRGGQIEAWKASADRAKALFADSWPLILSGLAVMIYMRIDQIMLGQMLGDEAVGVYTAAVRISEVWYFVPIAVIASVMPSIIGTHADNARFNYRMQRLSDTLFIVAVAVALPMSFLSDSLMVWLFGEAYAGAGLILSVHIWASIFVCAGLVSSQWLILENLQRYILVRTLLGALINVLANLILIPLYGAVGAAVATVISYGISVYAAALMPRSRPVVVMLFRSFVLPTFFNREHVQVSR